MLRTRRIVPLLLLAAAALSSPLPAQRGSRGEFRDFRAELILAIEERDLARARQLIEEGADKEINRGDPSPLGEAIRFDQLNMTALLLRSGGDPNVVEDRPFKEAFENDSIDMVRLLYQVGARLTESELPEVLHVVLRGRNSLALYRELLHRGADVDLALRVAVENRKLDETRLCLERDADVSTLGELDVLDLDGLTPEASAELFSLAVREENREAALSYFLSIAAARGDRELLARVLGQGARVSLEHLERAEAGGHDAVVRVLMEETGEDLAVLAERAEAEERPELAAYLKGLRRERITSVVGPAVALVASLFVLLVLLFFLRKHVLHSPKRLHEAVSKGRVEALEKHLAGGADPNGLYRGVPLLHAAVAWGNPKIARLVLRYGADIDRAAEEPSRAAGLTALHLAAQNGNTALATLLVRHGARVDARTPEGLTPLYYAAGSGNTELLHLLVERGADLNAFVHEQTILHQAVGRRDHRAVATLLEAGADPNADRGKTALHTAATLGDAELIRLLLEAGADPYSVDVDGRTALDLATFHRQAEAIAMLQASPPPPPGGTALGRPPASPPVAAAPPAFEPPAAAVPPVFEPPAAAIPPAFEPPAAAAPAFETIVIPPPDPPEAEPPAPAASWAPSADSFTIPLPNQGKKSS